MSSEPAGPPRGVLTRYPALAAATVGIHHVPGGHVTRAWRIDTATGAFLLRCLPAETPADTAAATAAVQAHAAQAGLAPGLVVNDTGEPVTVTGGRLFTLSTHLQGANPARVVPGAGFCRRLGHALGQLHQQLRKVPAEGLRPWQLPGTGALHEALRAHDRPGCRHPAARRVLQAKLAHAQAIPTSLRARLNGLDRQVIHGDVHPGNILLTGAGPVFVDFDLARIAPPCYELMRALIYCTNPAGPLQVYRERVAAFLSGYLTIRPLVDGEIATMVELYRTVQVLDPTACTLATVHRRTCWVSGMPVSRCCTGSPATALASPPSPTGCDQWDELHMIAAGLAGAATPHQMLLTGGPITLRISCASPGPLAALVTALRPYLQPTGADPNPACSHGIEQISIHADPVQAARLRQLAGRPDELADDVRLVRAGAGAG